MKETNPVITAIYNKRLEVHYDEWFFKDKHGNETKLELQGKIKCPLLNTQISSIVCSKVMDNADWPRGIDSNCCKQCNCYIYLSIARFQNIKKDK